MARAPFCSATASSQASAWSSRTPSSRPTHSPPRGWRSTATYHATLRQQEFERHYRRFHASLPDLIVGPSAQLDRTRLARQFRLVHVDGGHEYEVVREDILTARALVGDGGIVIFDDWSQPHCPGVAMALWECYREINLIPLGFTDTKLYATWDTTLRADDLDGWVRSQDDLDLSDPFRLGQYAARRYTPKKVASPPPRHERSRWRRLLGG